MIIGCIKLIIVQLCPQLIALCVKLTDAVLIIGSYHTCLWYGNQVNIIGGCFQNILAYQCGRKLCNVVMTPSIITTNPNNNQLDPAMVMLLGCYSVTYCWHTTLAPQTHR
jgi:hypothetical protein